MEAHEEPVATPPATEEPLTAPPATEEGDDNVHSDPEAPAVDESELETVPEPEDE